MTPKKVNEAQVAKVTDQYIEKEIEEHKLADGDTSRQIGEKISGMKRLLEDLAAKAEWAASQ